MPHTRAHRPKRQGPEASGEPADELRTVFATSRQPAPIVSEVRRSCETARRNYNSLRVT